MTLLRNIEDRLKRVVEGTFAHVFRTNVQPVEIARRLVKEMDDGCRRALRSTIAPNTYEVFLSRDDFNELVRVERSLVTELSEYLAEHGRRQGYTFQSRPRVTLQVDGDLGRGSFGIATGFSEAEAEVKAAEPEPLPRIVPKPDPSKPLETSTKPPESTGEAQLVVLGSNETFPLRPGTSITIGRDNSCDVVLRGSSVSRHHAMITESDGSWRISDTGSTNGTRLNGEPCTNETKLNNGDIIGFGDVSLKFEASDGANR